MCLHVPEFQRHFFKHCAKCKWIPLRKGSWIPCTNSCNVIFVGTLVLLRTPQRAIILSCSPIPQMLVHSANLCGFRSQFAAFAYKLQNPLTICGFVLQFAGFTYSCGFHFSLSLLKSYIMICLWIPQTVPNSAIFLQFPQFFFVDSSKLPVFGAIFINSVLANYPWNPKQPRISKKNSNIADSATILLLTCRGICLQFTKCTVWPRNVFPVKPLKRFKIQKLLLSF